MSVITRMARNSTQSQRRAVAVTVVDEEFFVHVVHIEIRTADRRVGSGVSTALQPCVSTREQQGLDERLQSIDDACDGLEEDDR